MKRKYKRSTKSKTSNSATNNVDSDNEPLHAKKNKNARPNKEEDDTEPPKQKKVKNATALKNLEAEANKETESGVDEEYEVELVLDEKKIRGVKHYLIRWKGYDANNDSWEPESTLECPDLIADFKKKNKKGRKKKPKELNGKKPDWNENDNFEVDKIIDVYFKKNGQREFLVHWKGYTASDNSWEPEENMSCKDLIAKFMEKVEKAKEVDVRELRPSRPHTDRFTLSMDSASRRLSKRHQGRQRVQYHDAE